MVMGSGPRESLPPRVSLLPGAGEDPYVDLLSRTRLLKTEQRLARDRWFRQLTVASKDELLFELEVLLKSAACFANPRNHPGPTRRRPIVAQDYREATATLRESLLQALALVRQLLGNRDRSFLFNRYLETVLPHDDARSRLVRQGVEQSTPEDSLIALRQALSSATEVVEGVLRAQRVPFRLFYTLASMVEREVGHNAFFNPLRALEFRPEYDQIKSSQVVDLIRSVPAGEAQRLVALTFLSLFRMLRYLELLERITLEPGRRRRLSGRGYAVLSVLRSDARALVDYLRQRSGSRLAESYQRDLFRLGATELRKRAPALRASGMRLLGIRSALEGVAGNLQLEMRRTYLHQVPAVDTAASEPELREAFDATVTNLRPALRNAILFLGRALGVSLEKGGVFDDLAARRELSERLRRDIWMFAQIVRAFAAKAQHSAADDRWSAACDFQYVREFLAYFRAMGYPLLRATDYPRFNGFLAAMGSLEDTDLVDPVRLERAIDECMAFHSFLLRLFEEISKRDVLRDVEFDRRAAASTLRLYLGDQ
jgi:hypothetical protein